MFYKIDDTHYKSPEKEFFLLDNFLDKVAVVADEIASNFQLMCQEEIDKMPEKFWLPTIMGDHFKLLVKAKRDFKIEQIINTKEIYTKLSDNGLIGEILSAKLLVLDWLWEKAKSVFYNLRDGKNYTLFLQLLNQLKSILKSLLNVLGISSDIFDENFDLLMSMLEMCNQDYQE